MEKRDNTTTVKMLDEKVEVLAPRGKNSFSSFVESLSNFSCVLPFSDIRCTTLSKLSEIILRDQRLKLDPASVALGFWLRKANIQRLREYFENLKDIEKEVTLVPIGGVFHIAPSNVDTMFVYSWALSFLCGNANIVRVSEQKNEIVMKIIECIDNLMKEDNQFQDSNRFITYTHDKNITEGISKWCNHRVIWGGDETVSALRPLPLGSHASERVFGSKISYSVISASWVFNSSSDDLNRLASNFFNDMFWFDQMACSSPHILFWIGDKTTASKAISKFNSALESEVKRRGYKVPLPTAVKRLNFAFNMASSREVNVDFSNAGFVSLEMLDRNKLEKEICGGGLITHVQADSLSQIASFLDHHDQTITHFGFLKEEINELAIKAGSKGISRVVPVGEALSFGINWDGYNLISDFIRRVVVRN